MGVRIPRKIQWQEIQTARARMVRESAQIVGLRLIVCGGRGYADRDAVFAVLDRVHGERGVRGIIEGGATGADALARAWAAERGVRCVTVPADWTLGRRAGPLRNATMVAMRPDGVVAFPGGRGTADCCAQARAAGIKVWAPLSSQQL
jgi:hypothetical protein